MDKGLSSRILFGILALIGLIIPSLSTGQTAGVTNSEILIGSCSALDGPSRMLGLQTVLGASAYIDMVNAQGGVNGRKLKLADYDDSYDPEKAPACFARLQKDQVFAAGFFVGTPTAAKYVPLAEENKIPVVGLFTGAQLLYEPFRHYIINIRASYYDETREQIDHLWELGMKRIAVIHPDDAFGAAVLEGVKRALAKHNSAPVADESFKRQTLEVDQAIDAARAKNPEAVVLVGPYAPVAEIVKRARARNWRPQFLTVSFVGTDEFIKQAGSDAEGTIITQVVPPYYLTDLPTVALYRRVLGQYFPNSQPSFVSLEGFVDAMVLVEGLRRAGKDLTREKFIRGIESIHNFDVGLGPTLKLNYGPTDHKGFDTVYATIVIGGKPVTITDWHHIKR